jgi:hypothetical protein
MTLINVTNVQVLDNPTKFTNPFQFEITFECLQPGVKEGKQNNIKQTILKHQNKNEKPF